MLVSRSAAASAAGRAHRPAGLREHGVQADRAQQRALARHVRSGDQQERARRADDDVVADAAIVGNQRVTQIDAARSSIGAP